MSDDDRPDDFRPGDTITIKGGKRLLFRRSITTGRFYGGDVPPDRAAAAPENDLVLRQLQSVRAELKHIREQQLSDRQLLVRLGERVEQGFENVRKDIRELRSDQLLTENKILNTSNQILDIVLRLDEAESERFEIVEVEDEPEPSRHG